MAIKLSDDQMKLAPLFSLGANFSMKSYFGDHHITEDGLISVRILERFNPDDEYCYIFYLGNSFSGDLTRRITERISQSELPSFIFEMRHLGYLQNIQ